MGREDIPNLISVLRIFLSVPVVWMLLEQRFDIALILFAIAGFVATWINGFYVDTQSMTAALIQLEMVGRNVLLGASFVLGLEIGEFTRRPAPAS